MQHMIDAIAREKLLQQCRIAHIALDDSNACKRRRHARVQPLKRRSRTRLREQRGPVTLQLHTVVIIEVVDADHAMSLALQHLTRMEADYVCADVSESNRACSATY